MISLESGIGIEPVVSERVEMRVWVTFAREMMSPVEKPKDMVSNTFGNKHT